MTATRLGPAPEIHDAPTVMRYGAAPDRVSNPHQSYGQAPPWAPPGQAPPRPGFAFDIARWSRSDRTTAVASLALLLSLFAPWFHYSVGGGYGLIAYAGSASGLGSHAYLYLVLVLAAAVVIGLVLQAGYAVFPVNLPASRERLLLAATGIDLLLVLFGLFMQPNLGSGIGPAFGAYIGVIAAIVACAPQAMPYIRAQANGHRE